MKKKHLFNNETNKVMMQRLLFENRVQFTVKMKKFRTILQNFDAVIYFSILQ